MRQTSSRLARSVGLGLVAGLVVILTGCGEPAYKYVGSSDRDAILRVPRSWSAVNTDDVLKASGADPAAQTGWLVFYDASPKPKVAHVQTGSAADPLLVARAIPLSKDEGASITGEDLRELVLPGTAEQRTTATKAHTFALLENESVIKPGERGAHVRYSFSDGGTDTEIYDAVTLIDPKHHSVHVVSVHCSQSCYTAHATEIRDVVNSLTLKPT